MRRIDIGYYFTIVTTNTLLLNHCLRGCIYVRIYMQLLRIAIYLQSRDFAFLYVIRRVVLIGLHCYNYYSFTQLLIYQTTPAAPQSNELVTSTIPRYIPTNWHAKQCQSSENKNGSYW